LAQVGNTNAPDVIGGTQFAKEPAGIDWMKPYRAGPARSRCHV